MTLEELDQFLEQIRKNLSKYQIAELIKEVWQPDLMQSAVLMPFTFHENEIKLIFTKRSADLERHKGQVSFPGGLVEQGDKNPIDTALRETCEEINIQKSQIELLGLLPPFNSQTGYFIYPVVGFIHDLNGLQRNGIEVDRIFCIPYDWLADPENSTLSDYQTVDGTIKKVWFFREYEGELLWGITAKITREFIDLIEN